eukprot:UN26537
MSIHVQNLFERFLVFSNKVDLSNSDIQQKQDTDLFQSQFSTNLPFVRLSYLFLCISFQQFRTGTIFIWFFCTIFIPF